MGHVRRALWWRVLTVLTALVLIPQSLAAAGGSVLTPTDPAVAGAPPITRDATSVAPAEGSEEELLAADAEMLSKKLAGDRPLSLQEASAYRAAAAQYANYLKQVGSLPAGPTTFSDAWSAAGPQPIYEVTRSVGHFVPMNGRIGALAILSNGTFVLGAAGGGIWTFDSTDPSANWIPRTDDMPSLAIGALAAAPGNDNTIYAGTGEGALSGDSYFGNGILKSTDGGTTWSHVSGDYFVSVSISRLVVDPNDPNHLYAAALRGRGGSRRTSPAIHSQFGIWESHDGAATWTLVQKTPKNSNGATDLEMDPQNPSILYSSFWGDQVYKSTDGGQHWAPIMNGLPNQGNAANLTRFSIGLSHPAGESAVLYAGTDFIDGNGDHQKSRVFRSDDQGATWHELPTTGFAGANDTVLDYCGGQCFYDNVIEVDPTNPDVVYAGGQFNYGANSGGIFRSDDGGLTWKDIGWDLHPDYHAFAFDPADPNAILVGSDGGVWYSPDQGGRQPGSAGEADRTTGDLRLYNLNGYGLQIGQFTSVATNPTLPELLWGGTQDNGTMTTYFGDQTWWDFSSGDGGQVLVDPTDWHYVYGTYYGITPYRYDDGGFVFTNAIITNGINTHDRAEFYVPMALNQNNPSQLFLGTYRLYRTDNAKATQVADVTWQAISPDLTAGCTGTAPNGARGCYISAIGVGGGTAVYTGSETGRVYMSPDAQVSSDPTWIRIDQKGFPKRPVSSIAVDRSNYRIAYFGINGFNAATPGRPGHVFKTTDGGKTVTNISGNLPDSPVNSVVLDPSFPNTIYVGTDVGPFVTYDGGAHWYAMGSGFPIVSIWQLNLDTTHRMIAAGTHGRGVFTMTDSVTSPALVVSKVDAGVPVGPSSTVEYTINIKNIGNADATGVGVTDPIPQNTSYEAVADGGSFSGGTFSWSGLDIAAGASVDLHFSVSIAPALKKKVDSIVNDGITVTSAEGPGATGSPTVTPIAPPYAVGVSPASQAGAAKAGNSVSYQVGIQNLGYTPDSFDVALSDNTWSASLLDSTCTSPLSTTATLAAGATEQVCVEVSVPGTAVEGDSDGVTVTATSTADPSATASGSITTYAVTHDVVLIDGDGNAPDVQSYYTAALDAAGVDYSVWDLADNPTLPQNFLNAHSTVVWYTGNTWPNAIVPYEAQLTSFLDGGGNLFMNGQDILDQSAGTHAFVQNYLHINWDGSEAQNDIATVNVNDVAGTLTDGLGSVALDHSVLNAAYEDEITPNGSAVAIFTDDSAQPDGLSYSDGYKVVFLAFPFEAYGDAATQADLMNRVLTFFAP